jgi:hypothetical protein
MQYPVIQANASNVYVAWTQTVNGFQQTYFTSSTNYGSTFSTPIDVDGNTTTQCVTPVIGSWGSTVYVAMACGGGGGVKGFSYVVASTKAGASGSWSKPFLVSPFHEPQLYASAKTGIAISDQGIIETQNNGSTWTAVPISGCCGGEPWVWGYGSNIYVAWETKGSTSQTYYAYSHDNGTTWTPEILLSTTITDAWGPKIAAWGNNVTITVTVHPASGHAQDYIYTSHDAGVHFAGPISESGTSTDIGTSLNVNEYGDYVFAIYGRETTPSGHWITYATYSTDGGTTWVAAPGINISNNANGEAANPNDISSGWVMNFGPDAFACWSYQPSGSSTSQIYFASSS